MPFDPNLPRNHTRANAAEMRDQFNGLKDLIDAIPAPTPPTLAQVLAAGGDAAGQQLLNALVLRAGGDNAHVVVFASDAFAAGARLLLQNSEQTKQVTLVCDNDAGFQEFALHAAGAVFAVRGDQGLSLQSDGTIRCNGNKLSNVGAPVADSDA